MDKIFSGLFGGNDDDTDETRTQRAGDFIKRVESGDPTEGYSTAEALQNYRHVASKLPEDEYVSAARDALARFTPQQRQEFGQLLSQKTGANIQGDIDSPDEIAQLTNRLRSDQSNPLGALLGGSGGLDDIIGALSKGGSGGVMGGLSGLMGGSGTAANTNQGQTSGIADLIKNPIVQAVLAAIAAAAMKRYGADGGGLSGLFRGASGGEVAGATSPQNPAISDPTSGPEEHSGGGLLDTLFGGGNKQNDTGTKSDQLRNLEKHEKPRSI